MDENGVHTSVVIELGNHEESQDKNKYKIEPDDMDPRRNYVIDQIFSGDNVTVYTLLEISDADSVASRKSEEELVEVKDSRPGEGIRFYHRNSYKKELNEANAEECRRHLLLVDSEEDQRKESFCCLKPFGANREASRREEENPDLKVLYDKDALAAGAESAKFKAVSRGVNTLVSQCPKLLEEVQRAVSLNFSFSRPPEDATETAACTFSRPRAVIEVDPNQSASTLCSEADVKIGGKSSPDFVVIPLLMLEDGILTQFRRVGGNREFSAGKTFPSKPPSVPIKVSTGVNTDGSPGEENAKDHQNLPPSGQPTEFPKNKSNEKAKTKETILEEMRDLQWKLNALVRSLESNSVELGTGDVLKEKPPTPTPKTRTKQESSGEYSRRSCRRFDDIPIISPATPTTPIPLSGKCPIQRTKRTPQAVDRAEKELFLPLVKTASSLDLILGSSTSLGQNDGLDERIESDAGKEGFDEELFRSDEPERCRRAGTSKSDSNVRHAVFDTKHVPLRKSVSVDLREENWGASGIKNIKNSFFKAEGSSNAEAGGRTHQSGLTSADVVMADEGVKKSKISVEDLLTVDQMTDKGEDVLKSLKKIELVVKKNENEEEGEAKVLNQSFNLAMPKSCTTNSSASDALLKVAKNSNPPKPKFRNAERSSERGLKICSDSEKTTTINRNSRQSNAGAIVGKSEERLTKKAVGGNKMAEKPAKSERREPNSFLHEQKKTKAVTESRKSSTRNEADSRLHANKSMRKTTDSETKADVGSGHRSSQQIKGAQEEKTGAKTEARSSRPAPQKRERRELTSTPSHGSSKEKEAGVSRKNSAIAEQPTKCVPKVEENSKDVDYNVAVCGSKDENLNSSKTSSIIFELFSKKPSSADDFCSEIDQDSVYFDNQENSSDGKNSLKDDINDNYECCENSEKPVVRSVWALTKVLLYEDGTKKFEVLEASSTPPEYSLKMANNELPEDNYRIDEKIL